MLQQHVHFSVLQIKVFVGKRSLQLVYLAHAKFESAIAMIVRCLKVVEQCKNGIRRAAIQSYKRKLSAHTHKTGLDYSLIDDDQ